MLVRILWERGKMKRQVSIYILPFHRGKGRARGTLGKGLIAHSRGSFYCGRRGEARGSSVRRMERVEKTGMSEIKTSSLEKRQRQVQRNTYWDASTQETRQDDYTCRASLS